MRPDELVVFEALASVPLKSTQPVIYDRPIGLTLLHRDERSGAEHYLIRYPAGLRAKAHRHSAAHTMVVLEGALEANGRVVGAPSYAHFPGGTVMTHAPAGDGSCLFVLVFDGPFDVQPVDDEPADA